eukprot:gene16217-7591_t
MSRALVVLVAVVTCCLSTHGEKNKQKRKEEVLYTSSSYIHPMPLALKDPLKGGVTTTLECSYPLQGRYLFIIMKGKAPEFLTLCQVEVFAGVTPLSMVNLALKRATEQSSTKYGGVSSRAVDGDLSVDWKKGACTYTKVQQNPWLEVKLDKEYVLGRIRLTNRGDCCGERLSHIEIRIGNVDRNPDANALCVKRMAAVAQAQSEDFYCTSPIRGKYVYVILRKKGLLTLCELEVCKCIHYEAAVPQGGVIDLVCQNERTGRYEFFWLLRQYAVLHICELEVYSY